MQRSGRGAGPAEFKRLAGHQDPSVRLGVVAALAAVEVSQAVPDLEGFLQDPQSEVRIAAVQALSDRGDPSTLSRVEPIVLGKPMRDANLREKLAFFQAYAVLAGDSAIEPLRRLLLGGLFRRRADVTMRGCAARALGRIGTPAAKAVLEKARADKDFSVQNAVEKELQDIG